MKRILQITAILAAFFVVFTNSPESFGQSPRMVLVEEATNASCPPCAAQNPIFKAWLNNHTDQVIPLIYHAWWPGANDPMYLHNTAMNQGRIGTYYGMNNEGVPICRMNGKHPEPTSAGWYKGAPGDTVALNSELSKYTGKTSPITLTITQTKSGNNFNVGVKVATTESIQGKKLRVAVVEYHIYYAPGVAGSNGETDFYYVARRMLPDHNGTTINQSAGSSQDYTFNVPIHNDWKAEKIYIVAFIQDDGTKEVLQAAHNLKKITLTASVPNPFLKVDPKSSVVGKVTFTNPNSVPMNVAFAIDQEASGLPSGWTATIKPTNAYLQPGASATIDVTINAQDVAGFVGVIVKATPLGVEGIPEDAKAGVYALSTKSKLVYFYNTTSQNWPTYNALNNVSEARSIMALMPIAPELLQAYPPIETFDYFIFAINYNYRGLIGASLANGLVINLINSLITAGKGILITSEFDLTVANGPDGTPAAKQFYSNTLGVRSHPTTPNVRRINDQGTQLFTFPATGVANDPIGDGFQTTMNQYNSQSWPFYVLFTDILEPTSKETYPFLYYDNDPKKVGGVRVTKGNSRIVYMTAGFEAIAADGQRIGLMSKIIEWLMNPAAGKGPEISLSVATLDFGEVVIGESSEQSFSITNTGDQTLTIQKIDFGFETGAYEFVNLPKIPVAIEPGAKLEIKVKFTPKEEGTVSDIIDITSNAKNAPTISIFLDGKGKAAVSVSEFAKNSLFELGVGPNPFSGNTFIHLNIKEKEQFVELALIDAMGRLIKEIAKDTRSIGNYTIPLNANELSSGIYFLQAKIGSEKVQIPVTLVK